MINEVGRKLSEVMDKFMGQVTVMVSQIHTYLQTHQVVYINYV